MPQLFGISGKDYFRSQILGCASIARYWHNQYCLIYRYNLSVPVLLDTCIYKKVGRQGKWRKVGKEKEKWKEEGKRNERKKERKIKEWKLGLRPRVDDFLPVCILWGNSLTCLSPVSGWTTAASKACFFRRPCLNCIEGHYSEYSILG